MSQVRPDAWSISVDSFIASLPAEHRTAFKAPADPTECLKLIERAQLRNRKFDRLSKILQPLVDPLRMFESSIDILIQTNSTFASPVWGPLKVVITLISDRLNTLQGLAILLERLADPLKRFQNYERLFNESRPLRNAVGALYCDLIEFCTRIVSHFNKTVFRKAFGSFDKDVEEISDKIRHHWTEVDIVANAANIEEAKAAREAEEIHRMLDIRKDTNRWLSPSNVNDDLYRHQSLYMPGSCDWIINDPIFQQFMNANDDRTLRIQGRPGSGKSTAAAFTIKHLITNTKDPVLYFFCKASDAERTLPLHILRTLLWQLLDYDDSLYALLIPWQHRNGRPMADSEFDVRAMFEMAFSATRKSPIYLVIDALDECENPPDLLRALFQGPLVISKSLKIILLSRDDPALDKMLEFSKAHLSLNSNSQPVDDYIRERVSKIGMFANQDLCQKVTISVIDASEGLWLFARLLLDEIERAPSFTEVQRQIDSVPHGLKQLYTSIISAKEPRQSELQIRMAQQLYLWLDTSEYVPEWLWKETNGDSLEDDMITNLLQYASSSQQIFSPLKIVRELCAPLIEARVMFPVPVSLNGVPHDDMIFTVEFFHQTAKNYLKWTTEAPLLQLPTSLKPKRLGGLHRGVTAAWYFSECADFQYSLQQLRERPRSGRFHCYFEMACGLWGSLKIKNIRRDLHSEEQYQVEDMCDQMTWFLTTDKCLPFLEVSIIIHFAEKSTLLLDNTEEALKISSSKDHWTSIPAFRRFQHARQTFMGDLAYTLVSLWPKFDLPDYWATRYGEKPEGFNDRALARKILALATRYQSLLLTPGARSNNCFTS